MGARELLNDLLGAGIALNVDRGKLLVTPASKLTDDLRAALRECKPELIGLLTTAPEADRRPVDNIAAVVVRRCTDCLHLTQANTCAEPVAAGLLTDAEGFGVVWPPAAHASNCPEFSARPSTQAADRPDKLTQAQRDVAHAEPWDNAAIGQFQARVQRLVRLGFNADDADDLAEQMHLRDVHADYRHLCVECRHHRPGRCGNHMAADLRSPDVARDLAATFQHCGGFHP